MYRWNRILLYCLATLLLWACKREALQESRSVVLSFAEVGVKTSFNQSRTALQWNEGDEISVYNDYNGNIEGAGYQPEGNIRVAVPVDASRIKATYPRTAGSYSEPGFEFPLVQTQVHAGVLNGANYPLVAEADIVNDAAVLHFSAVGSAFALNVYNPRNEGEKLQRISVKPAQKPDQVQVSLTTPFAIGTSVPSDKRTYGNQVYACIEKGSYNKIEFTVRTDRFQYRITSNEVMMDLENSDFFAVNIDLANLKVYIGGVPCEDFIVDTDVDVTLASSGFVELVENLPEDQLTDDIIPDFSTVGYHWGEAEFPDYSNTVQLPAPSGSDDTEMIQSAIDSAPEGTVIQFQAGRYIVDGMIIVDRNAIILRGYGKRETEIFARGTLALDDVNPSASQVFYPTIRPLVSIGITSSSSRTTQASHSIAAMTAYNKAGRLIESHPDAWYIYGTALNSGSVETMGTGSEIIEDAFCGSKFVTVKDASTFNVGDDVVVYRPGTQEWIHDIKMDNIIKALDDIGTINQWSASSYSMKWERTVKAVVGDRLYLDAPLVMSISKKYGGGEVLHFNKTRIKECGIENFRLVSDYNPDRDTWNYGVGDVYHACDAVAFYGAEHCWVRDIETHFFSESAVVMSSGAKNITAQDCVQMEPAGYVNGGLRYAFHISGGQKCLVKNCRSNDDRHQFVTAAKVPGPNVFTGCTGDDAHSVLGPHQRWATGTLYDMTSTSSSICAVDAGNSGTGQGWQGVNQVFWNCKAAAFSIQSPWVTGYNYAIGCKFSDGSPASLNPYTRYANPGYDPLGNIVYDSAVNGTRESGICRELLPGEEESLYESQLKARLSSGDRVSKFVSL